MSQNPCKHRVRFSASDSSGELCFTDFEVIEGANCPVAKGIQEYLVGRALNDFDWRLIEDLGQRDACTCADDVIELLEQFQEQFQEQFSRRRVRRQR